MVIERPLPRRDVESTTGELKEFFARYPSKRVAKHAELIQEGAPMHYVFLLEKGTAFLYRTMRNGAELGVSVALPGDLLFGGSLAGGENQTAIRTLNAAQVRMIPLRELQQVMKRSPSLAAELFEKIKIISRRERELKQLLTAPVLDKVGNFLLFWYDQTRNPQTDNETATEIHIPFSQRDMAKICNCTNFAISRAFRELAETGLVTCSFHKNGSSGAFVKIHDLNRLRTFLEGRKKDREER